MTQTIDDNKGLSKKMLAAHLRKTLERRNGANSDVCRMAATMSDELLIEAHSLFVEETVEHLERATKGQTT